MLILPEANDEYMRLAAHRQLLGNRVFAEFLP